MASGVTVNVPLRDLLCAPCSARMQPVAPSRQTGAHRFETAVRLPNQPGSDPITVPLDVGEIEFDQQGPHSMAVRAKLALPCSGCGAPHEVSYQLQAAELFVRNLWKCSLGHPQALRDLKIKWSDGNGAPGALVTGTVYCPICGREESESRRAAVENASLLATAKVVEVDMKADKLHLVDAPVDAVPLPRELEADPLRPFPMLRVAGSVLKRKLDGKPFAGLRGIFVLHFLTDLIPFAQVLLELGLQPQGTVFFYKAKYQYPHRTGVLEWLRARRFDVRPVEAIPEYLEELEQAEDDGTRFLIVEDGGYFTPLLQRTGSRLAARVIGAVEQTTKGLRATEDWARAAGGSGDFDGLMRFPLISIPDSKIKQKVEPPLIAQNILNCIQALDHSISFPGMRIALFGLGTIGMEVYSRLRDMGALVTGFDLDDSRRTEFRMKGGALAPTAAEAARGKKLVLGCSGRLTVTKDVIANLDHGAYLASGSSDQVEIDREYLEDRKITSERLGMGDRDWEPGRLWAGTRYILPGKPPKEILLLADGFPVTFWGFAGMPHQGGDLIMTVILIAAADLAARNGAPGRPGAYRNRIERHAVDALGREYEIEAEYLRQYFPDARA